MKAMILNQYGESFDTVGGENDDKFVQCNRIKR